MITYSKEMREIINNNEDNLERGKDRMFFKLDGNAYKVEITKGTNKSEYEMYERNKDKYGAMLMKVLDHNRNFKVIQVQGLKTLWDYVEEKTGIIDDDIEYINLEEALEKYDVLMKCKKFDDITFDNFVKDNKLNKLELECTFNWGITDDDRLVCLDYADIY